MKQLIVLALTAVSVASAQTEPKPFTIMADHPFPMMGPASPVQGAPYSATIVNESIQTLADGNRIVQSSSGSIARDAQGRTRQDIPLPALGNMSAANAPHLVSIQDPVTQTAYTLNLTDKTARKIPSPATAFAVTKMTNGGTAQRVQVASSATITATLSVAEPFFFQKSTLGHEQGELRTESLGTQTMQGVPVEGVRTTRTIAAGEIGNDRPISIVTEVWTSPELKTIVSSKRSDPRMGEQTFQLTNIIRSEPDPSLFAVPADFKLLEGPDSKENVILYRPKD